MSDKELEERQVEALEKIATQVQKMQTLMRQMASALNRMPK